MKPKQSFINPKHLAFDIDGVVADTMNLFIEIARKDYRIGSIQYSDITSYTLEDCLDVDPLVLDAISSRLIDGDYSSVLAPVKDAPEVLGRIRRRKNPLLFVTARPYPGPIVDWLLDVLSVGPETIQVITTGSFEGKSEALLEKGIRFFVEDRLETCFLLHEVGISPILFKQPWNREKHPFIEIGSWRELEAMIEF